MHGRLQRGLADDGTGRTVGLDFDLVVMVPHRLTDEGESKYCHRRVERQTRNMAHCSCQAVFGIDGGPEVGGDRSTRDDEDHPEHGDQQFAHTYILAQGLGKLLQSANLLVPR